MTVTEVRHAHPDGGDGLLAYVVQETLHAPPKGATFITPPDLQMQLGVLNHPNGHVIPPHMHPQVQRSVLHTTEVLVLLNGFAEIKFYSNSGEYVDTVNLKGGDVVLILNGGHSVHVDPAHGSVFLEVKQGPYAGVDDKRRL